MNIEDVCGFIDAFFLDKYNINILLLLNKLLNKKKKFLNFRKKNEEYC